MSTTKQCHGASKWCIHVSYNEVGEISLYGIAPCTGVLHASRTLHRAAMHRSYTPGAGHNYASHFHSLSQESRRKDLGAGSSKSAPSSSSVKIPAAHSTSPGLAPAPVSTTTSTARRTKHPGEFDISID